MWLQCCSDNIAFSVSYSVSSRLKYSVITWISSNAPDYLMDHMISSRLKEYFVVISDTFTVLKWTWQPLIGYDGGHVTLCYCFVHVNTMSVKVCDGRSLSSAYAGADAALAAAVNWPPRSPASVWRHSARRRNPRRCHSRGSKQKNCAHFEENMKLCMDKL